MSAGNCMRYVFLSLFLFWSLTSRVSAGKNDRIVQVSENVYARIASPNGNAGANSGFVILDHGVVVFDTHFTPEEGQQLLDEIRSVTPLPVRYVVNSNYHPDHTHGNQVFKNSQIIGSPGTREGMLLSDLPSLNRSIRVTTEQLDKMREEASHLKNPEDIASTDERIESREAYLEELEKLKIKAPFIVFDEYLAIRDGTREVKILCLDPGQSRGNTVMFIPSVKTIFCGSLFFNLVIPNLQDAKILEWVDTLKRLQEFDAETFIPGHGPPGKIQDVRECIEYFEDLRTLVEPFVINGQGLEQAMQEVQLPYRYQNYRFKNLFPSNIQRMYEELKEELILSIPIEGPQLPKN